MILPPGGPDGRDMAYCGGQLPNRLSDSTYTRIAELSAARAYPRSAVVYKLRTPSPGGQYSAKRCVLPAFFLNGAGDHDPVLREPDERSGVSLSEPERKGAPSCPSEHSFYPLLPVPHLRPAVRQSVTRPSVAVPSGLVRRSSPATAPCRAPQSVRRATSHTASLTRASVTEFPAPLTTFLFRPRMHPVRGLSVSPVRTPLKPSAQSKRDI